MYIPIPIGMSNSLDLEGKEEKRHRLIFLRRII